MSARHPPNVRAIVSATYEECAGLCDTTKVRAMDPVARKYRDKTRRALRTAIRAAHRRYLAAHVNGNGNHSEGA